MNKKEMTGTPAIEYLPEELINLYMANPDTDILAETKKIAEKNLKIYNKMQQSERYFFWVQGALAQVGDEYCNWEWSVLLQGYHTGCGSVWSADNTIYIKYCPSCGRKVKIEEENNEY